MEVAELVKGDLRPGGVEHEPPCVTADGGGANICANDHVAEEEPAGDEGLVALAGLALHDVVVGGVEGEGGGGQAVGDEVDPEELDGDKCFGHAHGGGEEDGDDLTNVGGDEVPDELLRVVVDGAAFFDGALDGGEVVVYENHVGGEFGYVGSGTHGDTNIGLLEGRCIVDAVASHGNNFAGLLEEVDELGLVSGLGAGKEGSVSRGVHLLGVGQGVEFAASVGFASEIFVGAKDANGAADGLGGVLVVACDDYNADSSGAALCD